MSPTGSAFWEWRRGLHRLLHALPTDAPPVRLHALAPRREPHAHGHRAPEVALVRLVEARGIEVPDGDEAFLHEVLAKEVVGAGERGGSITRAVGGLALDSEMGERGWTMERIEPAQMGQKQKNASGRPLMSGRPLALSS